MKRNKKITTETDTSFHPFVEKKRLRTERKMTQIQFRVQIVVRDLIAVDFKDNDNAI